MRWLYAAMLVVVGAACASSQAPRAPAATAAPTAVATPRPAPTERPPTATPAPDYRALREKILSPLGALIVTVREGKREDAAGWLAKFNQGADEILPVIERDLSKEGNALHSAIVNVRAHPSDLQALEEVRLHLLQDI
jgi:hypothetical protein